MASRGRNPRGRREEGEGSGANPMQQFVDLFVEALQNNTLNNQNPPAPHITTFKDFKSVGPPEFKGTSEPIEAQGWIKEMEKAFLVARVGEDQKTVFATYMMKEEANFWWEANQTRAGEGIVGWERFKELFFENYFPKSMQTRMEVRFLELKQGDMTVPQYAAKFNELARFAPHQVDTEDRKTRRFEQGLKPWLFNKLSVLQIETFSQILEKAIIAEGGSEALTKLNREKKNKEGGSNAKGEGSGSGGKNNKRKWNNNNNERTEENKKKEETCKTCGKNHMGVCLKGKNICYKCKQEGHVASSCPNLKKNACFTCGEVGHLARNCPKKGVETGGNQANNNNKSAGGGSGNFSKPTARTYNMTVSDAVASQNVVSGTTLVNSINAYVLFDSGATCSFVSHEFAQHLNLPCENLDHPISIEIANKERIPVDQVYKNCCVEIKGHKFNVDLIPIQLGEFDVILGMD